MDNPKVSIIIPVYNKEKYIRKTLDSVINQTFQDFELIIVNDGSTDKSRKIIGEYQKKDFRIKIIDISNGGVSNARNVGLANAQSEWIQFLDGDDIIDNAFLSTVFSNSLVEDVDIVFSNFLMVNEQGKVTKAIESGYCNAVTRELCKKYVELQKANGFFGFISNKLFKRRLLKSIDYCFDPTIKLAEDLDFYSRLYQKVKSALFIDNISFYYLQTDENYTKDNDIDYRIQLKVRLNIKRWFLAAGEYDKYKAEIDLDISQFVYLVFFHDNEKNISFLSDYEEIVDDLFVMNSLTTDGLKGFERIVIQAVIDKDYNRLCKLFQRRNAIRSIYRKVKRHG